MQQAELGDLGPRWGLRIFGLVVVLLVVGVGAFLLHRTLAGGETTTESYETYTVGTMTLHARVTTAGTAVSINEAELTFARPGQVDKIYVELGDTVKAGQPLISLKADDLQNAASTASSALALAQLQLKKLKEGATDTQIASANEAVTAAQAGLTKAQNDLQDALDPATDAQMTAAQQAVTSAEAALAAAEAKLDTLEKGATDADVAAAEASVTQAEAKVAQAERLASDAADQEANAQSTFEYAATTYCDIDDSLDDICQSLESNNYEVPLTNDQVDELSESIQPATRTPGPSPTPTATWTPLPTSQPTPTRTPLPTAAPVSGLAAAVATLTYANNTFRSAITTLSNAEDNVTAAQAGLDAAQAALDLVEEGASDEDLAAAQKGVDSANAALVAAKAALQQLIDGATDTTIADLYAAVSKAEADVSAATTARDELLAGAKPTDIAMQQEQVHQAELAVQKANIALSDATLTSPFDGVVSLLPVKLGQVVSSAVPAITILTPGTIILELNVGETELPAIRAGEAGAVVFDAIPGKAFPVEVYAVGLSPETNQGVIVYKVRCRITGGLDDPTQPSPSPGMSGSASIVTEQRADVVAVPSAAVRARGGANVVQVVGADGKLETRTVQTGLSDGDNIEITSGLSVGEEIAIRTLATPTAAAEGQEIPGHFQ